MGKTFKDRKDFRLKVRKGKGLMPSRPHNDKRNKRNDIYDQKDIRGSQEGTIV
ncbi:hypothetical protein UFOVP144_47 [uncultured Caudovirales phage]|uniref:Uncharacterized protein n=1 Tax=uncultured Caudovirales phage TaxID=2100421 RepID=A0A6J7XPY6_9CAUD|nr:hypothetical protein UFOVP144_47 [uncultured Caudovirales phage]